ncbi:HAMP domain-containing protein [Moorella sulfitireducens]|uniref:HAMP domain-containing protein n=1 Tax=Neomoorella sulfitireducens TaxID=2972948 RepID=UPI0021AD4935|nr:methyl-accepting chemotaxis protein [Moorella sulfitireducens]
MIKGINPAGGPRRKPIIRKLQIKISIMLIIVTVMAGSLLFFREQLQFRREYQDKGREITSTVALIAADYILSDNLGLLSGIIQKLHGYGNISYVIVTDAGGRLLAASPNNSFATGMENGAGTAAAVNEFTAPIKSYTGGTIGYVRLGLEPEHRTNYPQGVIVDWALFALVVVLAGTFLTGIVAGRILQGPLGELMTAAEMVSAGDFSYQTSVAGGDELADLAGAFNTMSFHLANFIQTVKISINDVQKGIEHLHSSLQTACRTDSRFLRNLKYFKESAGEQLKALLPATSQAEQLTKSLRQIGEQQEASLALTGNAAQTGEEGAASVEAAIEKVKTFCQDLDENQKFMVVVLDKGKKWSGIINGFANLSEDLAPFIVEVALEAAKTENKGLTEAAGKLSRSLQDVYNYLRELKQELEELMDVCGANREALEKSLSHAGTLYEDLAAFNSVWVKLERFVKEKKDTESLIQEEIEMAITTSQALTRDIGIYLPALDKLLQDGLSDERLPLVDWEKIDSLARKLLRMIERVKALAWQYKT